VDFDSTSVRCNDLTVPFPTAAISLTDPFADHDTSGIIIDEDDDHIIQSWRMPGQDEVVVDGGQSKVIKRPPRIPPMLVVPWLPGPFRYVSQQ